MRYLRILLLLGALLALAAGCGSGAKSVPGDSVAVVGSADITKDQFDLLMKQAERSFQAQSRPFPKVGTAEYVQLRDQAVQYLIQRAEYEQKAKGLGIVVTDKQVEDRLKQIKQQFFGGDEKKYKKQLKAQGLTDEQVHADQKAQLISEGIFKKVTADAKVTDAEVAKYYRAHKSLYGRPESRDVRHILVKDRHKAFELYRKLRRGGNFAALAKKFSLDPGSKAQGGKLTVSKGQTVPQFDRVAFSLKKNQISPPVQSQYGWHVIQALSGVRPAKATPFAQVKESIRQQLLQSKRNEAMTKWVNGVKQDFASQIAYQAGYAPPAALTSTSGSSTSK